MVFHRRTIGEKVFGAINAAVLTLLSLSVVYPFFYCVVLSFNEGSDTQKGHIYFWPRSFTLDNYADIFSDHSFLVAMGNSVMRTVAGTVVAVLVTAMFSYVVSRRGLLLRKLYIVLGVVTMYFSGGLIPTYLVISKLGLVDHFLVYILPMAFSMWNAIMMIAYFQTVPEALEESAKVDGANDLYIFIRIIIPVSLPIIACIGLFAAVAQWNAWFDTVVYTSSESLTTLSSLLMKLMNYVMYYETSMDNQNLAAGLKDQMSKMKTVTSQSFSMATMVVTSFPIIALYPFLQKYFVKGIMVGSLKG